MDVQLTPAAGSRDPNIEAGMAQITWSNAAKKTVQPDAGEDGGAAERRPVITDLDA